MFHRNLLLSSLLNNMDKCKWLLLPLITALVRGVLKLLYYPECEKPCATHCFSVWQWQHKPAPIPWIFWIHFTVAQLLQVQFVNNLWTVKCHNINHQLQKMTKGPITLNILLGPVVIKFAIKCCFPLQTIMANLFFSHNVWLVVSMQKQSATSYTFGWLFLSSRRCWDSSQFPSLLMPTFQFKAIRINIP